MAEPRGRRRLRRPVMALVWLVWLLCAGCAGERFKVPKAPSVKTGFSVAVLPVVDQRDWPKGNANVQLYPAEVRALLLKHLAGQKVFSRVFKAPPDYFGAPGQVLVRFTVGSFNISPAGYNEMSIPHAMLDGLVSPVVMVAMLISAGRADLGGYLVPSRRYQVKLNLVLEVLDPLTGRSVLSRSYNVDAYDYYVSERQWMQSLYDPSRDGIRVGRATGPAAIREACKQIGRDRYLARLPVFLRLGHLAADWQVAWPPGRRLTLIRRTVARLGRGGLQPQEESLLRDNKMALKLKVKALNALDINKDVKPYTAARVKRLEGNLNQVAERVVVHEINRSVINLLMSWLAELTLKARTVGLTPTEVALRRGILSLTAPRVAADRRLRAMVMGAVAGEDATAGASQEKDSPAKAMDEAVVIMLRRAGDPASKAWLEKRQKKMLVLLPEIPRGDPEEVRAARMLVVLMGPRAATVLQKRDENLVLAAVGPEDVWARPLVLGRLAAGDYSKPVLEAAARVRPTGAARLIWHRISRTDDLETPLYAGQKRDVVDRTLAVRVIGWQEDDPQVRRQLSRVVEVWWRQNKLPLGWSAATLREAVIALGRQRDRSSGPLLVRVALPTLYARPKPRRPDGEGYGPRPRPGDSPDDFIRAQADAAVRAARRWPRPPVRLRDHTWPEPVVRRRRAGVTTWQVAAAAKAEKAREERAKKDKAKKDKTAPKKKVARPLVLFNPPPASLPGAALWGLERLPPRNLDQEVWEFVRTQAAEDLVGDELAVYLDYLGRQRYTPAVGLMFDLARHPGAGPVTRTAAIRALGRIGGAAARKRLGQLAAQLDGPLADQARLALRLIAWQRVRAR